MKKNVILALFMLIGITKGLAQFGNSYRTGYGQGSVGLFYGARIGFKFSPGIVANSVEGLKNFKTATSDGVGLRMTVGPIADFYFSQNYAFSTGLLYTVKSVNYAVGSSFYSNEVFTAKPLTSDETKSANASYNLQYLQIPATIKIFSSQIMDNRTPIYLQFGGTFDVKIAEKALDKISNPIYQYQQRLPNLPSVFTFGDINMLIGLGTEIPISANGDVIFVGLQYQRGLTQINNSPEFADLMTKNTLIGLDFGIRF